MNNLYIKWGILLIKRNLKRSSFWVLTVITALMFQITSYMVVEYNQNVTVPIVNEGGMVGDKICSELLKGKFEGIDFVLLENSEAAETLVKQSKAQCAFVFTKRLDGITLSSRKSGEIIMYQSPSALSGYMIKELVFSTALKVLGPEYFGNYLDGLTTNRVAKDTIIDEYERYLDENSIDIFKIKIFGEDESQRDEFSYEQNTIVVIVMAVVFIAELIAVYFSARRMDRNFLLKFDKRRSIMLSMEHALVSAFMILFVAFLFYKSLTLFA